MTGLRRGLIGAVSLAAIAAAAPGALAQTYPSRGLTVTVPFAPGGQTDIAGRIFSEALAGVLKQTVTVVNKAGAGGAIGTAEVAKFDADGYRLGIVTSTPLVRAPNINNTPYSIDSFDYICRVYNNPLMFAVKKSSKIETPTDLLNAAKAAPMRYGSSGVGSTQHMAMIRLGELTKVNFTHVANSSDTDNLRNVLADVITGTPLPASVIKRNADTIKPVGVMDAKRHPAFPNAQTFAEAGHKLSFAVWGGLAGPKGMPKPVVEKLRSACEEAQKSPQFEKRMRDLGMEPSYLGSSEFEALVREENEISARLLKALNLVKK